MTHVKQMITSNGHLNQQRKDAHLSEKNTATAMETGLIILLGALGLFVILCALRERNLPLLRAFAFADYVT